jgi:Ca2+-binding RTX toxin-like protein
LSGSGIGVVFDIPSNIVLNSGFSCGSILIGGAGDDTLTGAGGRDIFDYGFKNAGNDIINDFTVGNILPFAINSANNVLV